MNPVKKAMLVMATDDGQRTTDLRNPFTDHDSPFTEFRAGSISLDKELRANDHPDQGDLAGSRNTSNGRNTQAAAWALKRFDLE